MRRPVSIGTDFPPPALPSVSQTSVPLTWVTAPGVPIELPPANTSPRTWNCPLPVPRLTCAPPPRVVQGCPPPKTSPDPDPTTLFVWMIPGMAIHLNTSPSPAPAGENQRRTRTTGNPRAPNALRLDCSIAGLLLEGFLLKIPEGTGRFPFGPGFVAPPWRHLPRRP